MESSEPSTSAKDNININPTNNETQHSDPNNDNTAGHSVDDFLSTGRTGRRNALPDILEQKSTHTNTADLPNQLQKLNFQDSSHHNGSSGSNSGSASSSNQNK